MLLLRLLLLLPQQLILLSVPGGHERLSDDPPEVGTCHRGEVKRIEAYGVFVAIQGFRRYGLVHASQVRGGLGQLVLPT